jgi:integrase
MEITGAGTVEKMSKDVWRIRFSLGKDPISGKYRYSPWRTVYGKKPDAMREREEYRREIEGGLKVDARGLTFGEFADAFHAERVAMKVINDKTAPRNATHIGHLKRYLEHVPLREIDPMTITSMYMTMFNSEKRSDNFVFECHVMLKQVLKAAVKRDYLMRSPMDKLLTIPKKPKPQRQSLTAEELTRFNGCLAARPLAGYSVAVHIALGTGMRRSEILGLTWARIDLKSAEVDVRQVLGYSGVIEERTKTDAGVRRIPIGAKTVAILSEWKCVQEGALRSCGKLQDDRTFVISAEHGGCVKHTNMERWWREYCVAEGFGDYYDDDGKPVPKPRFNEQGHPIDENGRCYTRGNPKPKMKHNYKGLHLHGLRHTYATQLIANGVDFKTVQYLMGHASATTTINFYAHAQEEQKRAAADLMGELLANL